MKKIMFSLLTAVSCYGIRSTILIIMISSSEIPFFLNSLISYSLTLSDLTF